MDRQVPDQRYDEKDVGKGEREENYHQTRRHQQEQRVRRNVTSMLSIERAQMI